jgi:hypothetical protein
MSTYVSEVHAASIIRSMEVAHTSETLVDIQLRTLQYIPEDSELHTHRHEKLKSHISLQFAYQVQQTLFTYARTVIVFKLLHKN